MSIDLAEPDQAHDVESSELNDYTQYRALSATAVAGLIVGVIGLIAFLNPWFVVIPIAGCVLSVMAMRKIDRLPDELSGRAVAKAGLIVSLFCGIAGPAYQGYVYATELPDGYARISYAELQPDEDTPGEVVPPSALALNGKRVFLKGYMFPGKDRSNIKQFVLCRDQGDCCFGGNPKITDRVVVTLADPMRTEDSRRLFRLAGTFRVQATQVPGELGAVLYHLDADYLK